MYKEKRVSVIIPALNEAESLPMVINDLPENVADEVIVVDNGSTDSTVSAAENAGARVLRENTRGYGAACQKGILSAQDPDIIVILDGDYSDYPERITVLLDPLIDQDFDMVIGSRVLGEAEKGSLTLPQILGNKLTAWLIAKLTGFKYTDMGPFRAVKNEKLKGLKMADKNYGWNVEMQIKAVKQGLKVKEIPVDYRKRVGKSKVSGTVSGVIKAGVKIIYSVFKYA